MVDKMARLAAGAQGGAAGMAAYDSAISNVKSQQQQALQDAAARSGALNAPQAFLDKQAPIVSQAGDTAVPLLQQMRQGLADYQGAMQGAQGAYMGGVGQSRNLLSNIAQRASKDLDSRSYSNAIDLYTKLMKQAETEQNGGLSPSEMRAQQQFQWSMEDRENKLKDRFDADSQANLESKWSTSDDPTDQAAYTLYSAADSYSEALGMLNDKKNPIAKEFNKLPTDRKNLIKDMLQQIYTPSQWWEKNRGKDTAPWRISGN